MHHTPNWKLRKNPFWRVGSVTPLNGELAYEASQDIKGKVLLTLPPGKKADHLGIKIQFIGRIDMVSSLFLGTMISWHHGDHHSPHIPILLSRKTVFPNCKHLFQGSRRSRRTTALRFHLSFPRTQSTWIHLSNVD
jgi:hypothetical protein